MKRIILALLVTTLCVVGFASPAQAYFKTPKGAVYCFYEGSIYVPERSFGVGGQRS